MDFLIFSACLIGGWVFSYFVTFHIALFLYKWLMPLKNKYGDNWKFKSWAWLPFFIGFALDIYWNVFHFSFQLWLMNKKDGVRKKFWPEFKKVTHYKKLYEITLTKRLQKILDTYPLDSNAYFYACKMRVLLNKYDPDHLTLKAHR